MDCLVRKNRRCSTSVSDIALTPSASDGSAEGLLYEAFGLCIRSAIPLPMSPLEQVATADLTIQLASDGESPPVPIGPVLAGIACSHGTISLGRYASDRGTLLIS